MKLQLVHGQFSSREAIDLLTQLVQVKIKFQESKINDSHQEEDIKMRENRIKQLQRQLQESRTYIEEQGENISIECELLINKS
jgi:hypothetical protein